MATTDLAGAPGVRVDNWNNLTGPASSLNPSKLSAGTVFDDTGAVQSGVSVSMTWPGSGGPVTLTSAVTNGNDLNLYSAIQDQWGGTAGTFTMSGIPYSHYDVYVYVYNDKANPGRGGSITIGSTTYWIATGTSAGNPASDGSGYVISTDTTQSGGSGTSNLTNTVGNYVEFTGLSSSSFTASYVGVGNANPRLKVAGFQVVAVPEPATLGLMIVGTLIIGLGGRRRRV